MESSNIVAEYTQAAQAHHLRALELLALGRPEAALASLERALALRPQLPTAWCERGRVLRLLRRLEPALASYERAIAMHPMLAEALNGRGNVLQELGRHGAALESYERALAINPQMADAYNNRGGALQRLGRHAEAVGSLEQALALKPHFPEAFNNLGNALTELGRFEAALEKYDAALALRPRYAHALNSRANALRCLNRIPESLASFAQALEVAPDHAPGHANRAQVLLLAGDFERGWEEYEWRWRLGNDRPAGREPPQPRWRGDQALKGRTILLHAEQGLGDTIQFCRYAPLVAAAGATVILEVPRPLVALLRSLPGVSALISEGDPLPPFELHAPLMSLPFAFATRLESIPASIPYLRADPQRLRTWQDRLGARTRPRVGVVWSGGFRADQPGLWAVNARRNVSLALLEPLKHPGIEFYSLQKGEPAEAELASLVSCGWPGPRLEDFTAELSDFADTAALIEQLDLVISVDTSTAHLAGALGKPVWILNRYDSCWRWLCDRSDSPWYPTARLYRQERPNEWGSVIERVRSDLHRSLAREPGP
jgi:tetratricopeptide (TPR) repeat protein